MVFSLAARERACRLGRDANKQFIAHNAQLAYGTLRACMCPMQALDGHSSALNQTPNAERLQFSGAAVASSKIAFGTVDNSPARHRAQNKLGHRVVRLMPMSTVFPVCSWPTGPTKSGANFLASKNIVPTNTFLNAITRMRAIRGASSS
jgi:hypothetical protein